MELSMGSKLKESQLTKITMYISVAGEDFMGKSLSGYFNEWVDDLKNIESIYNDALCKEYIELEKKWKRHRKILQSLL